MKNKFWKVGCRSIMALLVLGSCERSDIKSSLSEKEVNNMSRLAEFKAVFPILKKYEWEVQSLFEGEYLSEVNLEITANSGDTTLYAFLTRTKVFEDNNSIVEYTLPRFISTYVNENISNVIYSNGEGNTLYHYKYEGDADYAEIRVFVTGKYNYLYYHRALDSLQLGYYLNHKDSLDKISGDNLPDLPRSR